MSTRTLALERIASGTAGASMNEVEMARALLRRSAAPPTHSGGNSGQHRRYGTPRESMLGGMSDRRMSTLLVAEAAAGFDWHNPGRRGWRWVNDGYGFAAIRDFDGAYHCDQCGCSYEKCHVEALRHLPGWQPSTQWFVRQGDVICPGCVFGAIRPTQIKRFIAGPSGLAITG